MKVGDRIRVTDDNCYAFGEIGTIYSSSEDFDTGKMTHRVEFDRGDWGWFSEAEIELLNGSPKDGCECGCTAVGSPFHSWYCPLHAPNPYD